MTFFSFQQDSAGNQEFQVSEKWWYFLAATIPLTAVVFLVWIVWQKLRFGITTRDSSRKVVDLKDGF